MEPRAESQAIARLRILARVCCLWGLLILLRLFDLQILEHEAYRALAEQQQQRRVELRAPRGEIFDRNGERLARSVRVDSVCVNPLKIPDHEIAAELLARVLGLDRDELLSKFSEAARTRRGFLWVKRKITPEESASLRSYKLDWVEFRTESRRAYPKGPLASHVIGSVDHEERGNAGIEQSLNADLEGLPGMMRTVSDVKGGVVDQVVFTNPHPGLNIRLTVDERIQYVAEKELRAAVYRNHCRTGSLVVMKPDTGEVLAIANTVAGHEPFDPGKPVKPEDSIENRANLAVTAPFEPGSVFKVITMAAALETTHITPESRYFCGNGRLTLFKRVIHDVHPYGWLSVADILAKSSNIGAIQVGLRVGDQRMYDYVRKFGFGRTTGIPLPGESAGLVWPLKKWIPSSIGSIAMGHELLATTVQLAQACSVVANGGTLMHPRIVLSKGRSGEEKPEAPPAGERIIRAETAATLRAMMMGVVERGTGTRAQLNGYSSAGKTGSAQIFDHATKSYSHRYNASFMGFAPVNRPAIVVVVTLNGASKYGGAVAAPVFERVASAALRFLDVPKDMPEKKRHPNADDEAASDLAIADLGHRGVGEETPAAASQPEPAKTAPAAAAATPSVVRAEAAPVGPAVPDFQGKTLQAVLEESQALGITLEYRGTGIARGQDPPPGAPLRNGHPVKVIFAR